MRCYADHAEEYFEAGWSPIPLPTGKKFPPPSGFTGHGKLPVTGFQVADWAADHPEANIGLSLAPGLVALDVDHYGIKEGETTLGGLISHLGELPPTYRTTARRGAQGHYFYRVPVGVYLRGKAEGSGIEILQASHRYSIGWPSVNPETATTYKWYGPDGVEILMGIPSVDEIPELPKTWLDHLKTSTPVIPGVRLSENQASEWFSNIPIRVEPCQYSYNLGSYYVRELSEKGKTGEGRHDIGLSAIRSLVASASEGHSGIPEILQTYQSAWLSLVEKDRSGASDEFDRMLTGAVALVADRVVPSVCPCREEVDITIDGKDSEGADHAQRVEVDVTDTDAASEWFRREVGKGRLSNFYDRGGQLTHVGNQVTQPSADVFLALVRSEYVGRATKIKYTPEGEKFETRVTRQVSKDIVHAAYHGGGKATPNLRELKGILETPVVRPDGTPLSAIGYDSATGLLLRGDLKVIRPESLEHALKVLDEPLGSIPWVSSGHRANYLGAMFTPLLRLVLPPPWPLVVIEAPTAGTGKTMLAQILRILHGGVTEGPLPKDKDELAKSVSATLSTTTGSVVIRDNQRGVVQSPFLDMLLTSETISARILGRTATHHLINDRLWVLTMNGATVGGDLHRRVLPVALDARMRNPETRRFSYLADEYVTEHRGEILGALLYVAQKWTEAGSPTGPSQADKYSKWRKGVGGLLKWSGLSDVFDSDEDRAEIIDPDREEFDGVVQALYRGFGDMAFTTKEVVDRVIADRPLSGGQPIAVHDLPEFIGLEFSRGYGFDAGIVARRFGAWLRERAGRVAWADGGVGTLTLARKGRQKLGTTWQILKG